MDVAKLKQIVQQEWEQYEQGKLTDEILSDPDRLYETLIGTPDDEDHLLISLMQEMKPESTTAAIWLISQLGDNKEHIKTVLKLHGVFNNYTVLAFIAQFSTEEFNRVLSYFNADEINELVNTKDMSGKLSILQEMLMERGWETAAYRFIQRGADVDFEVQMEDRAKKELKDFWQIESYNILTLAARIYPFLVPVIMEKK